MYGFLKISCMKMNIINGNIPLMRFVQLPIYGFFGFDMEHCTFPTSTSIHVFLQNFLPDFEGRCREVLTSFGMTLHLP